MPTIKTSKRGGENNSLSNAGNAIVQNAMSHNKALTDKKRADELNKLKDFMTSTPYSEKLKI